MEHRVITFKGFLDRFFNQHEKAQNKPFCFIIGAGCSIDSKIKSGTELATEWLKELHTSLNFSNQSFEEWATEDNIKIKNFSLDKIGDFYTSIYELRFKDHQDDGFAYLENEMDGVEPSYGYAVLASVLSNELHKIVITTNFDNLIADAISLHGENFPLVLGHDSLASYADTNPRRPLIVKIHGSLGFDMKNSSKECGSLPDGWTDPLKDILQRCTPIVMGYAGNDGSLMNLLKKVKLDNIYWLKYGVCTDPDKFWESTNEDIKEIINNSKGFLVPSNGFDKDMLLLNDRLDGPDLFDRMKERLQQKLDNFDKQQQNLRESLSKNSDKIEKAKKNKTSDKNCSSSELKEAVSRIGSKRKDTPWWIYQEEIDQIKNLDEKEKAYKDAISKLPNSYKLIGNAASFLHTSGRDYDEAEKMYRKALEIEPKHANSLGNLANFLKNIRKNYDDAEQMYRKAIDAEPEHANNLANYANFLKNIRKNYDGAEQMYRKAIDAEPEHANTLGNFASFLKNIRKNYDEAETFYLKAIEVEPNNADNLNNYAILLAERGDYIEAEKLYEKAILIKPEDTIKLGNYASLLLIQGYIDKGLVTLKKAESKLNDSTRKDLIVELRFYRYCHDLTSHLGSLSELKKSLLNGDRSPGWHLEKNIERAELDGHPNVPLLKSLADVITAGEDIIELDKFPDWKKA